MRMTVYYNNGIVMEMENVKDRRKFWRQVSRDCKVFSKMYRKPCRVTDVVCTRGENK